MLGGRVKDTAAAGDEGGGRRGEDHAAFGLDQFRGDDARGDLSSADRPATTTGGKVDRDISPSDLARVKVDSIEKVSDSCGAPSNPQ